MDYVFADQRARRLVIEYRVWEDDYIAGSDHRLVSCVVKPRPASPLTANFNAGYPIFPGGRCRIRIVDLKYPQLRTAAVREFKAGRKQAKEMIIEQLGPLLYPGRASKRGEVQRRLDTANGLLKGYIGSSLGKGGLTPKPVRCANSRSFWDHSLTLVKKERNRLWKAAISHPVGSAEAVFLESKTREVQKRLKSEVRLRK